MAKRVPQSGLKESIAFIRPIVPTEIMSSTSPSVKEYFFAMCATSLKFLSIKISLAFWSPDFNRPKYFASSSLESGGGKVAVLPDSLKNKKKMPDIMCVIKIITPKNVLLDCMPDGLYNFLCLSYFGDVFYRM